MSSPLHSFLSYGGVLFLALVLLFPAPLAAQEVRGIVRDQRTDTPLANVLVRVDSLGSVTLTDDEGQFFLRRLPKGRYTLVFKAMGYDSLRVSAEVPADPLLVIQLLPKPVPLRGIEVRAPSLMTRMDTRLARLPGFTRVADSDRIRLYDTLHAKDPWKLLWRELRVGFDMDVDNIRYRGRTERPEVYLDDRRTWLINLVLMPNTLLCRVETYEPPRFQQGPALGRGGGAVSAAAAAWAEATGGATAGTGGAGAEAEANSYALWQVPFQIRAYTCLFMAEVMEGKRTLRSNINWGGLIAGPGGG